MSPAPKRKQNKMPLPETPNATVVPPQRPPIVVGDQVMAKMPSLNSQWEVCKVVSNPNDANMPAIEFPDGSIYASNSVEIGGKVLATAPEVIPESEVPKVNENYAAFQQILVNLNAQSERLFNLPLDVLLTMVYRWAMSAGLPGSGKMGVFGGTSQFVPDDNTMNDWVQAYLFEIQRREAENAAGDAEGL